MARVGTRSQLLAIDDIDYTDAVSKAVITVVPRPDELRVLGEPDYEHGGMRDYRLALTFAQDTDAESLWHLGWSRGGELVAFHLAPHGNLTATEDRPHFAGRAFVSGADGDLVGGEASTSISSVYTSDALWVVLGTPERLVDGEEYPALVPEEWAS